MPVGLDALAELDDEYADCDACPLLCKHRTAPVFGSGSATARIMVVGEAPGPTEDQEGVPFIGPSGRRLMDLLRMAWPETEEMTELEEVWERYGDSDTYWNRLRDYLDEHIFWTNTVLCLPQDSDGDIRAPTNAEVKACRERLERTVYAVDPLLIIAAGKAAASALVGKVVQITKQRGEIFDITITSPVTGEHVRYPCLAILHPAYLMRKGDAALMEKKQGETYETYQDLKWAIEHLLEPEFRDNFGTHFPHRPTERP